MTNVKKNCKMVAYFQNVVFFYFHLKNRRCFQMILNFHLNRALQYFQYYLHHHFHRLIWIFVVYRIWMYVLFVLVRYMSVGHCCYWHQHSRGAWLCSCESIIYKTDTVYCGNIHAKLKKIVRTHTIKRLLYNIVLGPITAMRLVQRRSKNI